MPNQTPLDLTTLANWIVPLILLVAVNYLRQIGAELKTIAVELAKLQVRVNLLEGRHDEETN